MIAAGSLSSPFVSEIGYEARQDKRPPTHGRRAARGSGGSGGSRGKLLITGGAAVAVLLVVVVVAVLAMRGGSKKSPTAASARVVPRVYVNTPDNPQVNKLNNRSDDKRPLTEGEVFDPQSKTVTHAAYTFTLAGADLTSDCKSATWGAQLQGDLAKYGCTQIARGAYVSNDKKYLGQFIVLNLNNLQGSEQIVRDLDPDANAGGVSPLQAPGSPDFSGGFSAAYSQAFGHFVVVSWVERAGGAQPQTMNELLDASIAIERADDFIWERLILAGG